MREREAYAFRYRCCDCVHASDPTAPETRCTLGHPTGHLADPDEPVLDDDGQWIFCKDFELM